MENLQRQRLLTRLHGAKYAPRDETVVLCMLAAEEITRLDHDCRVLYGLLMRQSRRTCPCAEDDRQEVCS